MAGLCFERAWLQARRKYLKIKRGFWQPQDAFSKFAAPGKTPDAVVSSLHAFMCFRSSTRKRFPLQFDLIVINGGSHKTF